MEKSKIFRTKNSFLYQGYFSFLLLEVCFQLLSVTLKIIPFQFVHVEPALRPGKGIFVTP